MIVGTPLDGAGALAILLTGLAGSVHCALMCGPLASAARGKPPATGAANGRRPGSGRWLRLAPSFGWHLGRIGAYAVVGAGLGAAGGGLAAALARSVQPLLPWIMAAGFVASAFDFSRWLPSLPGLHGLAGRLARLAAGAGPTGRALALGAATPFLPCGLLWGIFLVAIGAGSSPAGSAVMTLFALGGSPGLAAVQVGTAWVERWPRAARWLRVGVPLAAAAMLIVRALAAADPAGAAGSALHQHHS